MRMVADMARNTADSPEKLAAERMARLGMVGAAAPAGSTARKVAVPPAAATASVVDAAAADEAKSAAKGNDQRLCIIVSREQARKIKRYALENDTTVSDLLRGYIDSL